MVRFLRFVSLVLVPVELQASVWVVVSVGLCLVQPMGPGDFFGTLTSPILHHPCSCHWDHHQNANASAHIQTVATTHVVDNCRMGFIAGPTQRLACK